MVYASFLLAGFCLQSCDSKNETNENDAAEVNVPAAVQSSFTTKYPGAVDVDWDKETTDGKDVYEAEFKVNDKEIKAEFDAAGVFIKEKND